MKCECSVLRFGAALLTNTALLLTSVLVAPGVASAAEPLSRPDWSAIFSPDGTVIDLQGGADAFLVEDKVSEGVGLDMSVVASADATVVDNGLVEAANDVANGYVFAKRDASGNLQIYAGVERLHSPADTHVEFEFYQGVVQVHSGAPWPIHGERQVNDVRVRVDFVAGALSAATFMRWDGSAYQTIATVAADGNECNGTDYMACGGAPPLTPIPAEVWDADGNPVLVRQADSFVEVGFNAAVLLDPSVNPTVTFADFTSLQVRTPQDIILDGFRRLGFWARGGGQ